MSFVFFLATGCLFSTLAGKKSISYSWVRNFLALPAGSYTFLLYQNWLFILIARLEVFSSR